MSDDPLRELIQSLPDEIAAAREEGLPVVLERITPLPAHAQRLMDTLGVEVRIVSAAVVEAVTCPVKSCSWVYDGDPAESGEWLRAHLKLMHASSGRREPGSVTPERLVLADEVKRLRDTEGLKYREICERLRISYSYAQTLYSDRDGSKARARKDSYRGVCIDCGGPTTGSEGRGKTTGRCSSCQLQLQLDSKTWTHDAIVDAVQRFGAEYGRPPTSQEWSRADREHGYPAATSCYRGSRSSKNAPFENWADVIEAAGFPRPYPGTRIPKGEGRSNNSMERRYIVLHKNGDGAWHDSEVTAYNEITAIEQAAAGEENPTAGEYVAVRVDHFRRRTVAPVTRLTVQTEASA